MKESSEDASLAQILSRELPGRTDPAAGADGRGRYVPGGHASGIDRIAHCVPDRERGRECAAEGIGNCQRSRLRKSPGDPFASRSWLLPVRLQHGTDCVAAPPGRGRARELAQRAGGWK